MDTPRKVCTSILTNIKPWKNLLTHAKPEATKWNNNAPLITEAKMSEREAKIFINGLDNYDAINHFITIVVVAF